MAAVTGAWRARYTGGDVPYVGALSDGNGINPIHAVRGGAGRGIAPGTAENIVDPGLVDGLQPDGYDFDGYDDDTYVNLFAYGIEAGTADRPSWGSEEDYRSATGDKYNGGYFPAWGEYAGGRPGGTLVRSMDHGGDLTVAAKAIPEEPVVHGWRNKYHEAIPEDAVTSDPSQYEMQTSMRQRDQIRAGSQASGTASEYDAPIKSRIPGMRIRVFAADDSPRHSDMFPRQQDAIVRPFWMRTAGTGYREWMLPNEMYVSEPMQRIPPKDASQGMDTPVTENNWVEEDYTW